MCTSGPSGPSSAELAAQDQAARERAQADTDRINAQKELEKSVADAKTVADQTSVANADAARRAKNRTLLQGIGLEEDLEDATSGSVKKAKTASLISAL